MKVQVSAADVLWLMMSDFAEVRLDSEEVRRVKISSLSDGYFFQVSYIPVGNTIQDEAQVTDLNLVLLAS